MTVTLIRTLILYLFIIFSMRLMGKRQIGDMQPNDLVITILISEIAALPVQDINQPIANGVVAVIALVVLEIIFSYISMKFGRARSLLNGRPAIIINDGKIDQQALKRMRITVDDLLSCLRQQQVFAIDDVQYAIIETNGQVSILLKPEQQPVTVKQAKASPSKSGLTVPVICDGRLQSQFMELTGVNQGKVNKALEDKNIDVSEVFLMTIDRCGKAVIVRREEQ